jgi:putative tryptophan/tyrosine transport system substrate-binding protein
MAPGGARAADCEDAPHRSRSPLVSIADMSESGGNPNYAALFKELRRLGYIDGVNLVVTRYSGEGREERYPELCREVVRQNHASNG